MRLAQVTRMDKAQSPLQQLELPLIIVVEADAGKPKRQLRKGIIWVGAAV